MSQGSGLTTVGIVGGEGFGADALAALLGSHGFTARRLDTVGATVEVGLVLVTADAKPAAARAVARAAEGAGAVVHGVGDPVGALTDIVPAAAWTAAAATAGEIVARVSAVVGNPTPRRSAPGTHNGQAHPRAPRRLVSTALSERERESVVRYVSGLTVREVSAELGVATTTVSTHLDRARNKYAAAGRDASNKLGLLMRALEDGLLPCPCARDDFDGERLLNTVTGQ